MTQYPLLFSLRRLVVGNGFRTVVDVCGRALGKIEGEDEFTIYGVNPSGLAGCGHDRQSAWNDFARAYIEVLFDLAAESETIGDFRAGVSNFFDGSPSGYRDEWDAARAVVRNGVVSDLQVRNADDLTFCIDVIDLDETAAEPADNKLDVVALGDTQAAA